MISLLRKLLNLLLGSGQDEGNQIDRGEQDLGQSSKPIDIDIAPDDPILVYFSTAPGVVEIEKLQVDSPALQMMKEAGVRLAVPLVSQGELIGLLNLGARRSEQEYSSDDRRLLNNLATQAAPALRVAQLARQQQIEARERERMDQELRVARVIQQTLLPRKLPEIPGYKVAAHWQPARAVSGDFYDFFEFPDGKLGIIVADVTDKGVPAALVMATTRTLLREAAGHLVSPGSVLERANELLVPDIPKNMFVTCLHILLDPLSGDLVFANAGHNLPVRCRTGSAEELRARGMPLGLISGMKYEEQRANMAPGESLLLYSDGLVEAHNSNGEMFEESRLMALLKSYSGGLAQIQASLQELAAFTGPDWEQEDDVTLVAIEREPAISSDFDDRYLGKGMRLLSEFEIDSLPGNERKAVELVAELVADQNLSTDKLDRMKTAVAEATMNAMEHGNKYRPDLKVQIKVFTSDDELIVRIRDHGGGRTIPEHVLPDLDAKLAGLQSPRGWGLFLIQNMVDEMHVHTDETHHTVELLIKLKE